MSRALPSELPPGTEAYELEPGRVLFVHSLTMLADLSSLTQAERSVTAGLLNGHDNARIARERGTSVRTVANQVASIFRKLGVSSRGELAARLSPPA
ncbi:hypothetical protein BH11MYX4_BH11MYX4_35440 [soil metagenome]